MRYCNCSSSVQHTRIPDQVIPVVCSSGCALIFPQVSTVHILIALVHVPYLMNNAGLFVIPNDT